ncbi:MAG: thermonuclease family protein [Acidobacteriota bacterium]|nr:thermonuclease family protein [Acidobacteriota bacterium]MDH3529668.1 thermonuclease family protein [Acidobacteriota bacterium]
MKLLAFTVLFAAFAFANCEPVEYAEKPKPKPRAEQEVTKQTREITARVVGISDGDSIVVLMNGNERKRVRLATIDAPENHQAFGARSKQSLSDLIYNKNIRIESVDTDRYGRIVGEVFVGDQNVNLEQLRRGFAWHYKVHARQQSTEKRAAYETAENEARSNQIGLWKDEDPTPPWDYRKKNPRN